MDARRKGRATNGHPNAGKPKLYPAPGIPDSDDENHAEQNPSSHLDDEDNDYSPVLLPGLPSSPVSQPSASSNNSPNETRRRLHSKSYSRPFVLRSYSNDQDIFTQRIHGTSSVATGKSRQRTRTMESASSGRQPESQTPRPSTGGADVAPIREELGTAMTDDDDAHASIIDPTQMSSSPPRASGGTRTPRHRLQKPPPARSLSPPTSKIRNKATTPNPPDANDAKRAANILHLMNVTGGAMSGNLYFRTSTSSSWSLSYCSINTQFGTLLRESTNLTSQIPLIPNLRGCMVKTSFDSRLRITLLNVSTEDSPTPIQIRPRNRTLLDKWFAALLCWRPVEEDQQLFHQLQQYPKPLQTTAKGHPRQDGSSGKEPSIIKVGKMMFVDPEDAETLLTSKPSVASDPPLGQEKEPHQASWQKVSCILRENGELKIYTTSNVTTVATVRLSSMSRSAIQRLGPTVLNSESCLAIYPQYARYPDACSRLRPIFLAPDSRVLYEVWFVLLRAFTIPDLHGPHNSMAIDNTALLRSLPALEPEHMSSMFRNERSLHVRVQEARFKKPLPVKTDSENLTVSDWGASPSNSNPNYYAQISLNGHVKARTPVKYGLENPYWFDNFDFPDIAADVSSLIIQIKKPLVKTFSPAAHFENDGAAKETSTPSFTGDVWYTQSNDPVCGECTIELAKLPTSREVDEYWPMLDQDGQMIGGVSLRIRLEQDVILMDQEYQRLSQLLHNFSNALTIHIAECVSSELARLAECLLNIFQVSGQVSDWLMALAEEEIDGVLKEQPISRTRLGRRLNAHEPREVLPIMVHPNDREWLLRDMSKTATAEANLLFRGNTLLSRALDFHMKRLGQEYLEDTLGAKLREIYEENPECEVDPTKLSGNSWQELYKHWEVLLRITRDIWALIFKSANKCPTELRIIFRHIRACANDRYGDFSRSVPYTSVAAFLFLRFFCAAILNPKLFNLAQEPPRYHAQRTFTLVAKSLQGLANMGTFGHKEPWMEQMNTFLSAHRQEFKDFIDSICDVASDQPIVISASYSTPLAIFTRLPVPFREGFPSLPYLIDHSRNFAALVNIWLDNCNQAGVGLSPNSEEGGSSSRTSKTLTGELLHFHNLCRSLRQRTRDAYNHAERSENWTYDVSQKRAELAQRLETSPEEFTLTVPADDVDFGGDEKWLNGERPGRKGSVFGSLPVPRGRDYKSSGNDSDVPFVTDDKEVASDSAAAVTTDDEQAVNSGRRRARSPPPAISSAASSEMEQDGDTPNRRKERKKRKEKARAKSKDKSALSEGERDRSRSGYGLFGRKRRS